MNLESYTMKKCRHCHKAYTPRRSWGKFCDDICRMRYHREKAEVIRTPEYHLFLKWRRIVGPVTQKEVELFARWRKRSLARAQNRV
jgi:hypothetical protein